MYGKFPQKVVLFVVKVINSVDSNMTHFPVFLLKENIPHL